MNVKDGAMVIITGFINPQRTIREHYKQLYTHDFDNLDEMDQFIKNVYTTTNLI